MDYDLEAEKRLAITLVLDPRAWDYVADILRSEMFGSDLAGSVFEGVRTVVRERKAITPVTVQAAMVAAGNSGSVVPGWAKGTPATADEVPILAGRVRELWARRMLGVVAREVAQSAAAEQSAATSQRLADALASVQTGGNGKARPISHLVFDWLGELNEDARTPGAQVFYETGFKKFDEATGGLARGELSVFAARPGNGKSSWVMAVATNLAARGIPVGMFWLEDDWRDAVRRFLSRRLLAQAWRLRGNAAQALGYVNTLEKVVQRSDLPLYVDDAHGLTITDIAARMRRMHREHAVKVFILDHLGEVRIEREERWGDRHDLALGRVAREYRDTAKALGAVPILVSQMNRKWEQRGTESLPQMSDLDGSGQVEQAARMIAFVQMYRGEDGAPNGKGALHIAKATGGQPGSQPMKWCGQNMTWEEA